MADSVARVRILAQIEGLEGFDKLKSAFRGLQQAIGPADADLAKARKQILEFGKAGAKSQQVIKGQVDALKALQAQATIGSSVYRQLGKDVKALGGAYQEAATGVKQFSDAQLRSQAASNKPSAFQNQIAALKRDLSELNVLSRDYATALANIQRREIRFGMGTARQGVIARNQAFENDNFLLPDRLSGQPELPGTTAALNQRTAELTDRLNNLTRGGERWIQTSREIAQVQRQLNQEFANPAVEAARRRLEQSRNVSSGFLQFSTGLEDRIAIQKSIARNERKLEAEALARSGPVQGPPAPSELFRSIAGISNQTAANQAQFMVGTVRRSYQEVASSIRETAKASDGSIGSLQRQRAAWEQLRATISPLDKEYAQIEREARKAIAATDRQIGRRQIGNRGGAAQIGQGTGALAASGIFGGPEGFLGSAGGAALGAVLGGPAGFATGAFLGGSVGAYGGMARQALTGTADYAADISKLEIALKGITKSQEEYQRALAASASVTRDFNVPQLEATRGITQLSAAVIGAGGKVADAEVVFRNVTAAIKASGGSAEDVQGSLVALAQVFSKGKVTAEELQGQLGERLPGAVTMFAKATGRTLPQLQKDLEQGVVGLADLMKFIVSEQGLGQFEQRAKDVAKSSADAGARLATTWQDTRRAIGDALLPLAAEIRDSLGRALKDATPALVELAKGLAGLIKLLVDNAGAIVSIAKLALTFASAGLAMKAFGLLLGPINQGIALMGLAFGRTSAQAIVAQARLATLAGTVKALARAVSGPILITIAIVGAELVINYFNRIKAARDSLKKTVSQATGGQWLKEIGGDALDKNKLTSALNDVGKAYAIAADKANELRREQARLKRIAGMPGNAVVGAAVQLERVEAELLLAEAQEKLLESRYKTGIARLPNAPAAAGVAGLTDFSQPTKGDLDTKALDKLAKQQQDLAIQTAEAERKLADRLFQHQTGLDRKRYELQQQLADMQAQTEIEALTGVSKEYASRANQLRTQLRDIFRSGQDAMVAESAARQALAGAQASQSVVAGGGVASGIVARTGNTGESTGAHLDLRWGDGRPITRADADKYFLVNGKAPSSFGVTSGYGPRNLFGRNFHNGIDFGTPAGSELSLKGGAQFSRNLGNTGAGGYAVEVMTPEGTMKALHLMANSAIGGSTRQQVRANAVAGTEQADLQQASAMRQITEQSIPLLAEQAVQQYVKQNTSAIRERIAAIGDENEINRERFRLQMEGFKPEQIETEIGLLRNKQQQTKEIATATAYLAQKEEELKVAKDPEEQARLRLEIEAQKRTIQELPSLYDQLGDSIRNAAQAQQEFNDALRFAQDNRIGMGMQEGVQSYVESIGTMREATAQLTQNGIKGLEDQIFSLVTTGKANFREFAADILRQTARMIIQQLVLRTIFQGLGLFGGGGVFGGGGAPLGFGGASDPLGAGGAFWNAKGNVFAQNNVIPFASGGIVNKPTLFKFASGGAMRNGVMGEAGPEAIIPLKRGRDGKLGVSGGGGSGGNVTVNVSVDASGSKVQGDSGKGEQLGRAVSQAVQDELLRQKRPGGLLA